METLLDAVREAAGGRVWSAAVKLARDGGVLGVSDDGEEVRLRVKAPGKLTWHEVYLWPGDPDWGCDCELPGEASPHSPVGDPLATLRPHRGDALPRQPRLRDRRQHPRWRSDVRAPEDLVTATMVVAAERRIVGDVVASHLLALCGHTSRQASAGIYEA